MARDARCDRGKQERRNDHPDQAQEQIAGQSRLRSHVRSIEAKLHAGNHREKRPGHQRRFANREDNQACNPDPPKRLARDRRMRE